jgi:beta-lactam-binding protein with PASTA domain
MADEHTPTPPEGDLPEPDQSPFFASGKEPAAPDASGRASERAAGGSASEPAPGHADAESEPQAAPQPDAEAARLAGLGSTNPYPPVEPEEAPHDAAVAQETQLLPLAAQADQPFPPFDPAAAQLTQVIPAVSETPAESATPPEPAAPEQMVVAGSRVVIVVSRGSSEMPPAAFVGMPPITGMQQGEALAQVQQAGLSAQVFTDCSEVARGEVIAQLPGVGQSVPAGSEAVLLVSAGPAPSSSLMVPLPDVVGLSEADALAKLQEAGLSPQIVRDFSPAVPLGVVGAQLPAARKAPEARPKKRKKARSTGGSLLWLWLLLVFAILFAASGGAYYWLNRVAAVPNVVGLTQNQAEQAILAAGFKLGTLATTQTISASEVGKVTTQTPAPNTQLRLIDQVNIVISGGQKLFQVPNVVSMDATAARTALTSASLQVTENDQYSQTVPTGKVISQSPAAGQQVPSATNVGITVSLGVQSVAVPGVLSYNKKDAQNRLKSANLQSQVVTEYVLSGAHGIVAFQYPAAGAQVAPGTIVGLIVSADSTPSASIASVSVPSVVGQSLSDAQKTLKGQKLSNTTVSWSGTGRPSGEVVGQVPDANAQVPQKVPVILFVSNGK